VELAGRVARDYTTVSRQVAKLESLGLVQRRGSAADRRVREAAITAKGKAMTDLVDAARERIGRAIFKTWDAHDVDELVRLMRKFADAVKDEP
jgi:DNA-binding MarR family transcriptional regulator